jgi:hypothetical protein
MGLSLILSAKQKTHTLDAKARTMSRIRDAISEIDLEKRQETVHRFTLIW